jgi:phosphoribosyl 1,2-cyclic phosphodiesterase
MTFLGTGGGRLVVINQLRATGGLILEMDGQMMHIDPGPGALVRAKQFGVSLGKLTAVGISHCHPDHYADAELVIEAMTQGTTRSGGVLFAGTNVISGSNEDYRPVVSKYHLRALERFHSMKPGDRLKIGSLEVEATPTVHDEPKGVGFLFRGSKKIGYASDGSYFPGQAEIFRGCDILVLSVLMPRGKDWPKHMNAEQALKIIKESQPKKAVLTHFGVHMLNANPFSEAKYIEEETGVRTIAAKDGMVISSEDSKKTAGPAPQGLNKWVRGA